MTFQIGSKNFKTFEDAYKYRKSMEDINKAWAKMHLNSHYGLVGNINYKPVSTGLRRRLQRRDDMEKASIWVRLFGERPKKVKPLPGGASLAYPSSTVVRFCLLYTSPSPRDRTRSRMPSSA